LKTEWRWRREGTPAIVGVMGAIILVAYGVIPTLQKNGDFGRIYVAYGGVFIVASWLWGWGIDGTAGPVRLGRRRGGGCRGRSYLLRSLQVAAHLSTRRNGADLILHLQAGQHP
jgi:Uncharacterised BCR, YnfA/UPF0060 family